MNRQLVEFSVVLLAIAVVVAVLARRWHVPYTVFLLMVGLAIGVLRETLGLSVGPLAEAELSKELIFLIFLPPLLFEGTIHMDLEILRRHLAPVVLLAMLGTLIACGMIGASAHWAFALPWAAALLLATMLAPTDPVSVLALFKEEGVNKDLSTVVEGESVFNDGIAVVLYLIFLRMVGGESVTLTGATGEFLKEILLGGAVGLLMGYGAHWILGRIDDRFTEIMISVVLSWGVYLAADRMHASGVIAVVGAGIVIGNFGQVLSMSPTSRLALVGFWEVIAFLVNSILFLMMGLASDPAKILSEWKMVLTLFVVMVFVRSIVVYGLLGILNRFRSPVSMAWQHIINWGGIRGSIPIALVLGIPATLQIETADRIFTKTDMTQIVSGVVLLSLVIQGLTIGKLLRLLGFSGRNPNEEEYEMLRGRTVSIQAARRSLDLLYERGEVSENLYSGIGAELDEQLDDLSRSTQSLLDQHYELKEAEYLKVSRALLLAERASLREAHRQGILSEDTVEKLTEEIDPKLAEDGSPFYAEWQTDGRPEDDPEAIPKDTPPSDPTG